MVRLLLDTAQKPIRSAQCIWSCDIDLHPSLSAHTLHHVQPVQLRELSPLVTHWPSRVPSILQVYLQGMPSSAMHSARSKKQSIVPTL